jgi:glycosyltransferase involved in cell wall biosynthesis
VAQLPIFAVIPALDEEASLPFVLAALRAQPVEIEEIVVVDNGSCDATARVAEAGGASVLSEPRRGYGAACLCGIAHVEKRAGRTGAGDAVVVFLDADHSDHPEDLHQLVEPILARDADLVLGTRLVFPEARRAVPFPSRLGNGLAGALMRWRYGVRFTDLGPFRAVRLSALHRLRMRDRTWGWTVEMQLRACREGLSVREVPVRYRPRHAGSSKISGSLRGGLRAALKILAVLARHGLLAPRRRSARHATPA